MSTFDQIYLGMVIVGMLALLLTLAWAVIYTRNAPDTAKDAETRGRTESETKLAA